MRYGKSIARRFAEKYIDDNIDILFIIEHHDDAYNAWSQGGRHGNWYKAEERAKKLVKALETLNCLELYLKFYECDNNTGDKSTENFEWFKNLTLTI